MHCVSTNPVKNVWTQWYLISGTVTDHLQQRQDSKFVEIHLFKRQIILMHQQQKTIPFFCPVSIISFNYLSLYTITRIFIDITLHC